MKNTSIFILFLLAFAGSLSAKEIKGTVYGVGADNEKTALSKAGVYVIGSNNGALTDSKGKFKIYVTDKDKQFVISYTGYKKDTLNIDDIDENEPISVNLTPNIVTNSVKVIENKAGTLISLSDPAKSETITSKGLMKAACCNLAESFQTSPSVDVEYSDAVSGAKKIQLLGLQGVYSQLLTEKIPNLRGLGSAYGLSFIPGPWMESIQVSKGSASVVTGFESMTGQINVEFKKPENNEPLFFNIYGDMYGRGEINSNYSVNINDKLSSMLLVHGDYMNSEIDANKDKFLDKPLVSQINIMNRWKYQGEVYESVTGVKGLFEERKGGQKGYFSDNKKDLYGIGVKTQRYEFFTKNGFIFSQEPFRSLGTIVSLTHHKQESYFGKRSYDAEQNSFYTNILYQTVLVPELMTLTSGFSYQWDNYLETMNGKYENTFESVPGVLTEVSVNPNHDLAFIAGVRADFHNKFGTFITPRFHAKYSLSPYTTVRASAGKGFRSAHIYAENTGILASSRDIAVLEKLNAEEAWNFGLNAATTVNIFGMGINLNAEYYRTNFENQVVMDLDKDPQFVYFYNLDGKSYSNSYQFDVNFEPLPRFVVSAAYRINDVKMTYNGKLEEKPLQSKQKGYLNFMYDTEWNDWNFDLTIDINGGGRLPNTQNNPEEFRLKETFPGFTLVNAQITKRFDGWDLYLGGENLTDYVQPNPIMGYNDPFSKHFDSSMIWGPVTGRMIYAGIRISVK